MCEKNEHKISLSRSHSEVAKRDSLLDKLRNEIKNFAKSEFKETERFFCIIYGSYAWGSATANSDIDIMFVAEKVTDDRMQRCIDFVKGLHEENGLPLDTEIRYEHKVLIPEEFLRTSVSGLGFQNTDGSYYIPEIEKTRECLDSEALRHRFLHALMAHKHIFVFGDSETYDAFKQDAELSLINAITQARGARVLNAKDLQELLFKNGKDQGDFYLGFKDDSYLEGFCNSILKRLADKSLATQINNHYDLSPLWGIEDNSQTQNKKFKPGGMS